MMTRDVNVNEEVEKGKENSARSQCVMFGHKSSDQKDVTKALIICIERIQFDAF
jgi:hypothetical protein